MSAQFASLPLPFASAPVARFNGSFGYRLDGDQVELNADLESMAYGNAAQVTLQLWACDGSGQPDHAVKVAECPVQTVHGAWGWSPALPPAGRDARTMVMAVASNGELQDIAVLPQTQCFVQPRMSGCNGYRFDEDSVEMSVEAIENPRSADNLSGTLNLELWAVEAPYAGGAFQGLQIAQATLGSLAGEQRLDNLNIRVPAHLPVAGRWYLVLMLREWSADGFVTRDYTAFAQPYEVMAAAPVVEASAPAVETAAPAPVATPAKPATPVKAKAPAKVTKPAEAKPADTKPAEPKPAKAAKAEKAPAKKAAAQPVSINTASVDELAEVKGMTRTVAKAIVAGRPYGSVDELVRVKGLGEKSLAKLRDKLAR